MCCYDPTNLTRHHDGILMGQMGVTLNFAGIFAGTFPITKIKVQHSRGLQPEI